MENYYQNKTTHDILVRRKEHKLLPVFLFKKQTATGEGFQVEWPFVLISKHVCAMLKDF